MRRALTSLLGAGLVACAASASQPAVPQPAPEAADVEEIRAEEPAVTASRTPCASQAGVCLAVEPADAEIVVNGEPRGRASDYAASGGFLPLQPGIYQIMLVAQDYEPWRAEVAVKSRAEPLEVKLERRPKR